MRLAAALALTWWLYGAALATLVGSTVADYDAALWDRIATAVHQVTP